MGHDSRANNFPAAIENARQRFDRLCQRFEISSADSSLLAESLQELSDTVEELCVASEEVHQQNEELAATRKMLEEERQHYQQLFDFAPDGYLVTTPYGVIQEANSKAADLLEVRGDFLIGKPLAVFVAGGHRLWFRRFLARLQKEDAVLDGELLLQTRQGKKFPVTLTVSRGSWKSPKEERATSLRWILRDIRQRKSAEEQVKVQLKHNSILRDINLAITSSLDLPTILDVLLDRLKLLFPYPHVATVRLATSDIGTLEHVICRGVNETEWRAHGSNSPGHRTRQVLVNKLPVTVRNVQSDPNSRAVDFYTQNSLVSYLGVPLMNQGEVLGILCVYTREEHEFTKDELDALSGLAVQAALAIHNCRLYEKLKSQTVELRKARDELELRVEERTGALSRVNDILRTEIDERKQVEAKLRESEGQLMAFANQLEDHLIANDRLISVGELSASIAHEFNNPLQIILGFTQNLIQEESFSEARQQDLRIIEDEARRCGGIIRNLLDFARPTSNKPVSIVVDQIVRDSMKLVRGYLDKANVALDLQIPIDLPTIYGDPQPIKQVFINLFFNAVDAMPNGGDLKVEGRADADRVTIAVRDTGQGISAETLPRIFRPFFTTKPKRGTGLGLSVCDRIMKVHGGSIAVESSQGRGTTFFLYFPRKENKPHERVA